MMKTIDPQIIEAKKIHMHLSPSESKALDRYILKFIKALLEEKADSGEPYHVHKKLWAYMDAHLLIEFEICIISYQGGTDYRFLGDVKLFNNRNEFLLSKYLTCIQSTDSHHLN